MTGIARWNKAKTPAGADGWNLTPDIGTALDSANVVVPVGSQAERDALTPPLGKYAGMVVSRTDLAGSPLEVWDGARWWGTTIQTLAPNTANFTNPPAGYGPLTLAVYGKMATLTGNVVWNNGSGNGVATIPSPYLPAFEVTFTSISQNNSTGAIGTTYRGVVTTGGAVTLNWMGIARDVNNVIPVQASWVIA